MPYDKRKMQDLTALEYNQNLFQRYKNLWSLGDIDGINTLLTNNPSLKYKIFNAFNWNRLINLVNDQTTANEWANTKIYNIYDIVLYDGYTWVSKQDNNANHIPQSGSNYWQQLESLANTQNATYDSLVGKWQKDFDNLKLIVDKFEYVGVWESGQKYQLGNIVKFDEQHTYFCIQEHTSSASNQPPNLTYWTEAETMQTSIGIKVLETAPTNLDIGDIYFQIIN